MINAHIETLIEKKLDGTLSDEEQSELETLAANNPEILRRLKESEALQAVMRVRLNPKFGKSVDRQILVNLEREAKVLELLKQAKSESLNPFFEARVMSRIEKEASQLTNFFTIEISDFLARVFPRIATPAVIVASLAMFANASAVAPNAPILDALFGLPSQEPTEVVFLIMDK